MAQGIVVDDLTVTLELGGYTIRLELERGRVGYLEVNVTRSDRRHTAWMLLGDVNFNSTIHTGGEVVGGLLSAPVQNAMEPTNPDALRFQP